MGPALLLAVVLGAGRIPIPDSALRFPDPSSFLGNGTWREGNMVATVFESCGGALRGGGPGPQQLAARWSSGKLNEAEKLVVLLGSGIFHDRALLPAYVDALQSPSLRLRQAAAVGFFHLVGATPPLPSQLRDEPATWQHLEGLVRSLALVTRTRPLVRVWVDSFVAEKGVRREGLFAFRRGRGECLRAIRELAQPEDLADVLSLWPLLDSEQERAQVMRTIEMITFQRLVDRSPDPHQPNGDWQVRGALARVDQWVMGLCRSLDGNAQLQLSLERNHLVDPSGATTVGTWFAALRTGYTSFLPLSAERLMDLAGMAVAIDRQALENPSNRAACGTLAGHFPISSEAPRIPAKRR